MPRTASKEILVDDAKLIQLIKLYPELYDEEQRNAKESTRKKNAWKKIANELEAPVDVIKKAWIKAQKSYDSRNERRKSLRSNSTEKNLGFLDVSSFENSNENSRASSNSCSPRSHGRRRLGSTSRSLSNLKSISETDLSLASISTDTIAPQDKSSVKSESRSAGRTPGKKSNFMLEFQKEVSNERCELPTERTPVPAKRNQRPLMDEPSHLVSKETLEAAMNSTPRRQSGMGLGNGRNRLKKTPNPNESTRTFFESMSLTVSTFPQHLQAAVKANVCKIVAEMEYDLSSPKTR